MNQPMPLIPAPFVHRDRDNLTLEERGLRYADMLEAKIAEEGADSVLAFIMGADRRRGHSGAGSAWTAISLRIREICDRHGILLIH